jgi:hypothetical protein
MMSKAQQQIMEQISAGWIIQVHSSPKGRSAEMVKDGEWAQKASISAVDKMIEAQIIVKIAEGHRWSRWAVNHAENS